MVMCIACEFFQSGHFQSLNDNPLYGFDSGLLLQFGAKYGPLIVAGDWWRWFSAIFVQSAIGSLLICFSALWFTRSIELDAGFYRASLLFMVSGVYGYVLSSLCVPGAISCGAGGALCGFLGFLLSDLLASWKRAKQPRATLSVFVVHVVVLLAIGLTPYVDNWAHIGGGIMGVLIALMLLPNIDVGECEQYCHGAISFLAFPAMATVFMLSVVVFFRKVDAAISWCPGCYLINEVCLMNWCNADGV